MGRESRSAPAPVRVRHPPRGAGQFGSGSDQLADKRKGLSAEGAVTAPRRQFAALPFRNADGLQVMLVSSRETRRWVLPKGWPIKGLKPHSVAAREALEEAGLLGRVEKKPIGAYHYVKRMPNGAALICEVGVFPLEVQKQRRKWPERDQRTTSWFDVADAAELVDEPELREIILSFAAKAA